MLPTKFQVNRPFGSGEEYFQDGRYISDRNDFCYFGSTSHPDASYQVFKSIGLLVQKKKRKIDFQDGSHGGHLGFSIRRILAISDL